MIGWAIFQYDKGLREDRLVAVYTNAPDANLDALAMSNDTQQPSVQPFEIHTAPQYTSVEPAVEESAVDFDTPIHVSGEVR